MTDIWKGYTMEAIRRGQQKGHKLGDSKGLENILQKHVEESGPLKPDDICLLLKFVDTTNNAGPVALSQVPLNLPPSPPAESRGCRPEVPHI